MNIIFLRHGEATDNVNELFSDKEIYWSTLTEKGITTVKESIKSLSNNIDKIYVSPLPRTIQTAHYVSELCPNTEVIIDDRIREINHGKYTHKKNNEDLDNTRLKQINGDYFVRLGEYGENNYDIEKRLSLFLKDVIQNNFKDNTIMIVSHGSITSYMKRMLKIKTPHIQTGKMEIFNDVNFKPLFDHIKKLEKIKKAKINSRIVQVKNLNINPLLKKNLLKLAKEFNTIELNDQVFNKYIEGFNINELIQITNQKLEGSLILICFYDDFENFADLWMNHYLNIGIKNFVLVDNNSQDKTTEILKKYSKKANISFWKTRKKVDHYNICGLNQKLFEIYGIGKNYLVVNSNELFIYKNYKDVKISEFIEKEKLTSCKSLILDVYSNNKQEDYKYVDKGTYKKTSTFYGQRFYGGPYLRVLGINSNLQKIPLIKYKGKEVLINNHYYYPFEINNNAKLCTYLLRYQFLIDNKQDKSTFYNDEISILIDDLDFEF